MGKGAGATSFFSHLYFIHRFSVNRLIIAGIGFVVCLSAVVSLAQQPKLPQAAAQQRKLPQAAEPANIIRLRQEWFYQQRAYPLKRIPPGARLKALEQLHQLERQQGRRLKEQTGTTTSTVPSTGSTTQAATLSSTSWTLIGPQPTTTNSPLNSVSGRVTALAVDPTNSSIAYLGGAEGGVWKTTDGGTTWTPLTDNQPSLAVGSMAIDPSNHLTIYVGTGEEDFSLYNYEGAGVLKSTNGGSTWTQLAGPFVGPFASESPFCGGAYIGSIAVDPGNSQIILAGADFNCSAGSGIYRSTDGGAVWTLVLGTDQSPDLITGVVFDPTNGNDVYAAVAGSSDTAHDGIWKSTNAGLTWTLDDGSGATVFPSSSAGRISLAIAPSSPTTLYAGVASASSNSQSLLGVYKTTNGGAAWTQLTTAPQYCSPDPSSGQCYFDNVVAVSPTDPNAVLLGGSEAPSNTGYAGTLYLSLDGGSSWTDITTDSGGSALHPDMHSAAFSSDGSKLYVGNDGGLWSTSLNSTGVGTWTDLNQSLALTQFYPGMSMDPTNPNNAFAGSQDNGIQEYSGSLAWSFVGCGDGGQTAFDYSDLNTLFISCQYVPPNTNPDGSTADFLFKLTANPPNAVAADNGIDGTDNGAFIPPLTMDPSNPNTLYFGTYRVYQTTDGAANWAPVSYDLTTNGQDILSTVSAIAVGPSDSNTVYAGTGDGRLWVTTNAASGAIWSSIANGTPDRSVTAIAVDAANAQTAYVTFSGYSGFNSDTLGHVFKTTNGGTAWADFSGNLPNVPVNDIVADPDIPNTLYIATDIGVFETTDGGTIWAPLGTGLPAVVIMSLKLQHATRILRAASYGRSAWDIQLPTPVGPTAVLSSPAIDFAPQQVGTTSPAQTVTLTNNSSSALSISSIAASSDFAETNTCGTGLAAGANCKVSITFTPAALGAQTGTVTISDNAASGSPQTIILNGKGFSGTVSLSPTSLSFGNQLVGTTSAAQTVTLTNTSTAPLTITNFVSTDDFKVTSDCPLSTTGALAGGASCHINISFSPRTMGTVVEQVTITDSAANSPQSIPVTGTGIAPVISISPSLYDFGSQEIGTASAPLTETVSNTGTAPLSISSIAISKGWAGDFNIASSGTTCSTSSQISPGGSCTVSITFTPNVTFTMASWGGASAEFVVTSNAPNGGTAYLSGSGYSGVATESPLSLDFGTVNVGQTSQPQTVTLTNTGSDPLYIRIISIISVSSHFTESDNCPQMGLYGTQPTPLAPGATCTISVALAPTNTGPQTGSLAFADSANGYSQSVTLSGTGVGPTVTVGPGSLSFGNQDVGSTSAAQTETVANTGNANLTFSSISMMGSNSGDFAVPASGTTCSTSTPLAPNASCAIEVIFAPTAAGSRNAELTVADNAYNSPQNFPVAGSGIDFALAVASGSSSSVTVAPGNTVSDSLTLTPEGGFNQTVSLTCTGAPARSTCTVSPSSLTLDGTNAQNVKVTVTTTAPSLVPPGPNGGPPAPGGFAISYWWIALLMLLGAFALPFERRRRIPLLAGAVLLAAIALSCGGGGGGGTNTSPGTPAGNYNLTVTGASGNLTHQTTVGLTVQ